jgi:cobalt transporter subunit CbtA
MTIRILLAALAAGLFAGVLMTPVQLRQTVPLILHAEEFEAAGHHDHTAAPAAEHAEAPQPETRLWNTLLANLVTGAGFALLMAGVSLISGAPVRFANGLAWGAAGWLAAQFLPGLGLPPELPGFPIVDVTARQVWWTGAVGASAIGLSLLFLSQTSIMQIAGAAILLAPQLYGAPKPADISSEVPGYLAAEFVMASLATTLFFWLTLGLALGFMMDRYGKPA